MVGDEKPPLSCVSGVSDDIETLEKIEPFQSSEKSRVSSVERAAQWLSRNREGVRGPLLPFLRRTFDLDLIEAIDASKRAHEIEYGGTPSR